MALTMCLACKPEHMAKKSVGCLSHTDVDKPNLCRVSWNFYTTVGFTHGYLEIYLALSCKIVS